MRTIKFNNKVVAVPAEVIITYLEYRKINKELEKCYSEGLNHAQDNLAQNIMLWAKEWSQSPYSYSFYSSKNIDWGYKPEGSLRVSDHWNFGEDGEHCPTAEPVDGWAVCKFENGKYHLIKKF